MKLGTEKYRKIQAALDALGSYTSIVKNGDNEYSLILNGQIVKVYRKRESCNKKLVRMYNTLKEKK